MHFKDTWGAAHRDADPMLTSWTTSANPPPPPPAPPPPSNVPLISAFATVNSTAVAPGASAGGALLSTLRLYLGFWSVVATGIAPPANRTVAVSVATTSTVANLAAAAAAAATARGGVAGAVAGTGTGAETDHSVTTTATVWRIDGSNANPLAAWEGMGSPAVPSKEQLADLIAASVVHPQKVEATLAYSSKDAAAIAAGMRGDAYAAEVAVEVTATLSLDMMPNAAVMVTF